MADRLSLQLRCRSTAPMLTGCLNPYMCSEGGIWATLWGLLLVSCAAALRAQLASGVGHMHAGTCSCLALAAALRHWAQAFGQSGFVDHGPSARVLVSQWEVLFKPVPDVFRTPFQVWNAPVLCCLCCPSRLVGAEDAETHLFVLRSSLLLWQFRLNSLDKPPCADGAAGSGYAAVLPHPQGEAAPSPDNTMGGCKLFVAMHVVQLASRRVFLSLLGSTAASQPPATACLCGLIYLQDAIEECLDRIASGQAPAMLRSAWEQHRGTLCRGVNWDRCGSGVAV